MPPPPSLKARALRLVARREHSRLELERKLAAHASDPQELARLLDELQSHDLINESRVIESVVHRRAGRLGVARLRRELLDRGLDAPAVNAATQGLQDTESQRALAVWQSRFGALPTDARELGRQARFLASRGFAPELIGRLLKGRIDPVDGSDP